MIFLDFKPKHRQEYTILRDYHIERKGINGIMFVLVNEDSDEVFQRILQENQANNEFLWEKKKKSEIKFQTSGIERGNTDQSKLVVETGTVVAEKRTLFGQKKEVEYPAKRYRYVISRMN